MLLARPHAPGIETVNDRDCHVVNLWRAMQRNPQALAALCDEPVNEITQHAFHLWLVEPGRRQAFEEALMTDPDYYDLTRAARWLYGLGCWIGGGWCSGAGPWHSVEGHLVRRGAAGQGVKRQRPHLGNAGQGVHRPGVPRQLPHLGNAGQGVHRNHDGLLAWFTALQARLRQVRVCCGDWTRVLGPSVTTTFGMTGVFLDPPYSAEENRDPHIYVVDDLQVAHAVRAWCAQHSSNPLLRIALCGYGDVHDALLAQGWTKATWHAQGGMGHQGQGRGRANKHREAIWFSSACLPPGQLTLFGDIR